MTSQVNGSTSDLIKLLDTKKPFFKITIEYLSEDRFKEIIKLLDDYHHSPEWTNRIRPNQITVEKYQSSELRKCGRDGCLNLIGFSDSFCSEYCLNNYVSYDEDEMK